MTRGEAPSSAHPVFLGDPDGSSGLAEMLHQFLDQTLADGPDKVRAARRLRGALVFRAAEDPAVCVEIVFAPDQIRIRDVPEPPAKVPALTSDFLSVAHLASGETSPLSLLRQGKITARASLRDLPFLLGVLGLLRLPPERRPDSRPVVLALVLSLVVALVASFVWFWTRT